ncbi:ArsR/SmtB family transcription factor [Aureibacter tunicatorum]|uniref:ArsR family transcriptional regulator n=1 Tax=Aureibacter tunicatorum TaxID=866807 RepID=A0AAE3XJ09_9BACT|nr:metalloregulator ArsR/SmtB family transcription factor [Aureibacter tunicatorum]MDR6237044.1 ArsR family transcriptional regulator [Aureibacter tunicatorum]BDD06036.1 hypothetical protein AUTU_35190 [Aureibacter tunicatorum]
MRLKSFSLPIGSQIFKALSDEARIRILYLLFENKEMCISDLEAILDFTQSKTSRHLNYLKNSGIVYTTKHDQWVFYSIKEEVYDIISQMLNFLKKDQTLQNDKRVFQIMYSNRELAIHKKHHAKWRSE